jgi:hypothetical protein
MKIRPYVVRSNKQQWLEEMDYEYRVQNGYHTVLKPGELTVYPSHPKKETKKKERKDDDESSTER